MIRIKICNDNNCEIDDETRDEIKFIVKHFLNDAKRICCSLSNQALHLTLKSLSQNKNIKICKFDKGKGTTIMDSNEYYEKLESMLNDKSKFEVVNVNKKPTQSLQKNVLSRTIFGNTLKGMMKT